MTVSARTTFAPRCKCMALELPPHAGRLVRLGCLLDATFGVICAFASEQGYTSIVAYRTDSQFVNAIFECVKVCTSRINILNVKLYKGHNTYEPCQTSGMYRNQHGIFGVCFYKFYVRKCIVSSVRSALSKWCNGAEHREVQAVLAQPSSSLCL